MAKNGIIKGVTEDCIVAERVLLVHYENIQAVDLQSIPADVNTCLPALPGMERDELAKGLFDEGFVGETDKLLTFVSARFRQV